MFERYTDRSRRAVVLAQENARAMGHAEVQPGHLLLGLATEGDGVAHRALAALGLDTVKAYAAMSGLHSRGQGATTSNVPFAASLKRCLENALRESIDLGHNFIGAEHLLLGLIRDTPASVVRILAEAGITTLDVRMEVVRLLAGYQDKGEREESAAEVPHRDTLLRQLARMRSIITSMERDLGVTASEGGNADE